MDYDEEDSDARLLDDPIEETSTDGAVNHATDAQAEESAHVSGSGLNVGTGGMHELHHNECICGW